MSLCSTHMVQSVMPRKRCQIMIFLAIFLGILSPKRACFQLKLSQLLVLTSHNSSMMKVVRHQAVHAWIQSQNSCLTSSLVLGRQKMYCLEMKTRAMQALRLLTKIALCQRGHIKGSFLAWRLVKLVIPHKISLPFLHRSTHAWGTIDNGVLHELSGIVKK